ncbi:MAG: Asp-tRNA(Asn)/Glu-tRNA(Gln) amidotransferase subunit GatC [Betaproteobacteria bacterium]|nr:Asp-tRNA(Asn)/Glu-tRNA(Gln) amidotransferase subunit GatC [Betaproteobacteria bacterium]
MPLQPSDIERIATLARLRLDAAEQAAMLEQINAFFTEVVEPMRAVDTSGVQPLAHPLAVLRDMPLRLREDAPREPQLREAALRNAPAAQDGLFIVPRVVE